MSPDELKDCILSMGLTQAAAAHQIGVDVRTVKRWLAGSVPIPKVVDNLMIAHGVYRP